MDNPDTVKSGKLDHTAKPPTYSTVTAVKFGAVSCQPKSMKDEEENEQFVLGYN